MTRFATPDEFTGDLAYCVLAVLRFEEGEQVGRLGASIVEGKALLGPLEHTGQDVNGLAEMWQMMLQGLRKVDVKQVFVAIHDENEFLQERLLRAGFQPDSVILNMRYEI